MTSPTPDYEEEIDAILEDYAFETDGEMDCGHDGDFDKPKARQALLALLDRALTDEGRKNRDCKLCCSKIAVFPCTHILKTDTQVTMSLQEWESMAENFRKLQGLEAYVEDHTKDFDGLAALTARLPEKEKSDE